VNSVFFSYIKCRTFLKTTNTVRFYKLKDLRDHFKQLWAFQVSTNLKRLVIYWRITVLWDAALCNMISIIVSEAPDASMFSRKLVAPGFSWKFLSTYHST